MIEALIKGNIPKAKIPKAEIPPPVKISKNPTIEALLELLIKLPNISRFIPGTGINTPNRTNMRRPMVTSSLPLRPAASGLPLICLVLNKLFMVKYYINFR